jgi:SPOR domain
MTAMTTQTLAYQACDQCGSALDEHQRYCVVCGANRRHPGDPVARYLSAARRPRAAAAAPAVAPRTDGRWIAAAFALLPVAAAIGVLAGRGNSDVVAALRAQKAPVVQIGSGPAGTAGTAATAPAATIASDFTLARGFVVKLSTLPASGTDAAAVAAAKRSAKAKGATAVGLINPGDFSLTPSSGGAYLLYSGQFTTRAAAAKALTKLEKAFPAAAVVAVGKAAGATRAAPAAARVSTGSSPPTAKQKAQGAKVVQEIQRSKGSGYVQQQRNLPDTIVVP